MKHAERNQEILTSGAIIDVDGSVTLHIGQHTYHGPLRLRLFNAAGSNAIKVVVQHRPQPPTCLTPAERRT